jgi:hypothetical protein
MREIDLASPSWGLDPDEDSGQGFGSLSLEGLGATDAEIGALLDAVDAVDAEEIAGLSDEQLDELAAEGGYPAEFAPGTPFASWMDALPDEQFAAMRQEAAITGRGDELGYLGFAHAIDQMTAAMNGREGIRQAEDQSELDRRSGPRHNRPSAEERLASAVLRLSNSTYMYGQRPVDLAADPEIDGLLGVTAGTVLDAENELRYQLHGGLPPARARRQPGLPDVGRLARQIGLHA